MKRIIAGFLHSFIAGYLQTCAGAFHAFPYGNSGRYVVLMNERQYHEYKELVK